MKRLEIKASKCVSLVVRPELMPLIQMWSDCSISLRDIFNLPITGSLNDLPCCTAKDLNISSLGHILMLALYTISN